MKPRLPLSVRAWPVERLAPCASAAWPVPAILQLGSCCDCLQKWLWFAQCCAGFGGSLNLGPMVHLVGFQGSQLLNNLWELPTSGISATVAFCIRSGNELRVPLLQCLTLTERENCPLCTRMCHSAFSLGSGVGSASPVGGLDT